jgi:hypothetical protein
LSSIEVKETHFMFVEARDAGESHSGLIGAVSRWGKFPNIVLTDIVSQKYVYQYDEMTLTQAAGHLGTDEDTEDFPKVITQP